MRYYVLIRNGSGSIPAYVAAEVVRERYDDGAFRDTSLGANLGIADAMILTREELIAYPDGRRALGDWERQDDAGFDDETDRALERDSALEREAAAAVLAEARRRGLKVVRHRLAMSEPSDAARPSLRLHRGGLADAG